MAVYPNTMTISPQVVISTLRAILLTFKPRASNVANETELRSQMQTYLKRRVRTSSWVKGQSYFISRSAVQKIIEQLTITILTTCQLTTMDFRENFTFLPDS